MRSKEKGKIAREEDKIKEIKYREAEVGKGMKEWDSEPVLGLV